MLRLQGVVIPDHTTRLRPIFFAPRRRVGQPRQFRAGLLTYSTFEYTSKSSNRKGSRSRKASNNLAPGRSPAGIMGQASRQHPRRLRAAWHRLNVARPPRSAAFNVVVRARAGPHQISDAPAGPSSGESAPPSSMAAWRAAWSSSLEETPSARPGVDSSKSSQADQFQGRSRSPRQRCPRRARGPPLPLSRRRPHPTRARAASAAAARARAP